METERGDVVDRLAIVAGPGDRGGLEMWTPCGSACERTQAACQKIAALHRVRVLRRRHRATLTITNKSRRRAPNSEVRDMISGRSVALDPTGMYHQERHNRQRRNGSRHDPSSEDIADPREQPGSFNHRPDNDGGAASLVRTPVIVGRLIHASLRNPGSQQTEHDGEIQEGEAGGHVADEWAAAHERLTLNTEEKEEGGADEYQPDHERRVKDPGPAGGGDGLNGRVHDAFLSWLSRRPR